MLIACVQSDVSFASPKENVQRVVSWMERASSIETTSTTAQDQSTRTKSGADLVVFPECMLSGYVFDSRQSAVSAAIDLESELIGQIVAICAQYQQIVSVGCLLLDRDQLFNAALLLGPSGLIAVYRKVHLPYLGVDRFVDRGDQPFQVYSASTSRVDSIRIGMAICYDASFPEPTRVMALDGADVIALGTNWPSDAPRTPTILPPVRSMENHLFFVAANRVGVENGVHFSGRSSICGPDGVVLAKSSDDTESILSATIEIGHARNKRIERSSGSHVIDRFADRQPDFYHRIIDS